MSRYKRLLSNTAILGAGTFASKVLVFLLMPLYTSILSTSEFGTADILSQTANLLMPLAAVGICDGLFRFILDAEGENKKRVLSTAVAVLGAGSLVLVAFVQLLNFFSVFKGYVMLVAFYVIAANFHLAFANYVRAEGRTTAFAIQGIANTVSTIAFNIIFLVVFDMGVLGYVLSVVVSDTLVTVALTVFCKIYKNIDLRAVNSKTLKAMLKFSIPYIPTTMMWLITSVSDRYIVTAFNGTEENGLYAAAYKIPTLISLASGVFIEAWQLSSVKDALPEERADFFGSVYKNYMSIMFMEASVIISGAQIFTRLLLADSYYISWQYVPILVIATVFSALSAFMGSVYFLEKKSLLSMLTAMSGAIINVVLNLLLIPKHGAMGAAVATFISYLATYTIRAYDTGNYVKFKLHIPRVIINTAVLFAQSIVMLEGIRYWKYMHIAALVFLLIFNGKGIVRGILQIFSKKLKKV